MRRFPTQLVGRILHYTLPRLFYITRAFWTMPQLYLVPVLLGDPSSNPYSLPTFVFLPRLRGVDEPTHSYRVFIEPPPAPHLFPVP